MRISTEPEVTTKLEPKLRQVKKLAPLSSRLSDNKENKKAFKKLVPRRLGTVGSAQHLKALAT
jgi:hypothetical protein